jgi:hypothetical protein
MGNVGSMSNVGFWRCQVLDLTVHPVLAEPQVRARFQLVLARLRMVTMLAVVSHSVRGHNTCDVGNPHRYLKLP